MPAAHAGYAQAVPPVDWSLQTGGAFYKAAANESWTSARTVLTNASLNVGGRSVLIPASMRLAVNAPRFAAAALFTSPLGLGASALALALPYALQWALDSDSVWQQTEQRWAKKTSTVAQQCPLLDSTQQANVDAYVAAGLAPRYTSVYELVLSGVNCSYGRQRTYLRDDGVISDLGHSGFMVLAKLANPFITYVPLSRQDFENLVSAKPLPFQVPREINVPLPVEDPVINPSPSLQPQPMRVPQGNPQPVPNTNPQQYRTPVVDIVPAPNPLDKWRVDVQPKEIVSSDPSPLPDTAVPPAVPASGTTANPTSPDLCEKNPDILACQKVKLELPAPDDITNRDKEVTFNKNSGWGGGGSCPAPRQLTSVNVRFNLNQVCDFMSGVKPVALAVAWLIGGLILIGARGGSSD